LHTEQANLVDVTMPQMGVSVAEGTIVKWHKHVGDWVEADETVCEISTDKIDTELPSPATGRLVEIAVEENATVGVGTVLAQIDSEAQPGQPHELEAGRSQADDRVPGGTNAGPQADDRVPGGTAGGRDAPDRSHVISPVVRRVADEHDIDLAQVQGTGVGGRIRKKDVLAFVKNGGSRSRPLHTESPYEQMADRRPAADRVAGGTTADGARREALSPMRKQIAEHMVRSRRTAAHVTTVAEVDMSRVVARRGELKEPFASRGVSLTYLAFVGRATVAALHEHPRLNASVDGDDLVHHGDVNLGIAVALDDGLIVPVIHKAQRLNLEGLAAAIADVAERARTKRLTAEDVQGGTFTITNPGQFGTTLATPIVNQPQVAILDLEAIVKRPVVVESEGGDSIAVRPMVNLCLSFDHRALDGADAARFLGAVKARLEEWADDG
jgi:2-oxoglutarate dehydrogenase E2 component (dihydrolipoamide succinyltransferase)